MAELSIHKYLIDSLLYNFFIFSIINKYTKIKRRKLYGKNIDSIFFDITPKIEELALKCEQNNAIEKELYTKYEVKRGLRDLNGKGVLAGLTNISDVCASKS